VEESEDGQLFRLGELREKVRVQVWIGSRDKDRLVRIGYLGP